MFFRNAKYGTGVNSFYDPYSNTREFIVPHTNTTEDFIEFSKDVETVSLDDYFGKQRVDLVNIYVEGAEGLVQEGMLQLLSDNPDIIIISNFTPVYLNATGTDPFLYLRTFEEHGFSFLNIDANKIKIRPTNIEELMRTYTVENCKGTRIIMERKSGSEV